MKEFSKSNLLSRAIEIRPKNELVGHLSELSLHASPLTYLRLQFTFRRVKIHSWSALNLATIEPYNQNDSERFFLYVTPKPLFFNTVVFLPVPKAAVCGGRLYVNCRRVRLAL